MVYKIVLLRHGESTWNSENRFTGWTDVSLTAKGEAEAHDAAKSLKAAGYSFDVAFTSVLKRAIKTLWIVLEDMEQMYIPVIRDWRLNERHYGALQGLNKSETAEKHGEEQVKIWRRSYDIPPPELEVSDPRYPGNDKRYAGLQREQLPKAESLKLTVDRVLPAWFGEISAAVKGGKSVLIAAHGNSLRALIKYLDNVSENDIVELNIPTGIPLIYELDSNLKPIKHYYLADDAKVAAATASVANQGKKAQ